MRLRMPFVAATAGCEKGRRTFKTVHPGAAFGSGYRITPDPGRMHTGL